MRPGCGDGKIVLLEPRRLAARAAARRMAELLGEEPGGTVGYAMRMENRISARTRILVVTEGVLARMILDDPELPGVSAVIFDEFHERSLDGDFGLALALDVQGALRPDLRLLVMSATLDGARVAKLLSRRAGDRERGPQLSRRHPLRRAAGRHADRGCDGQGDPRGACRRERQRARLPARPARDRAHRRAAGKAGSAPTPTSCRSTACSTARRRTRRSSRRRPGRRKVVLATSIAETSITIDGVRVVIDSGLSRLPRYEPASGLTRLETVRVSRASADQRAGRAGRTQPGVAIRLWRAEQTAALARLHAAGNPRGRPVRPAARLRRLRRRRSGEPRLPRPAAGAGAHRGAGAAARARRHRRRRPPDRSGRGDAQAGAAGAAGAYGRRGGEARPGAATPRSSPCCSPSAALAATASIWNGG